MIATQQNDEIVIQLRALNFETPIAKCETIVDFNSSKSRM